MKWQTKIILEKELVNNEQDDTATDVDDSEEDVLLEKKSTDEAVLLELHKIQQEIFRRAQKQGLFKKGDTKK